MPVDHVRGRALEWRLIDLGQGPPNTTMQILVNGQPRDVCRGTTLAELVAQLGLTPEHIAIEVNRELVPRRQHADCELSEDDVLEVVTLVGGG
ncbi:MAG: sulfur carrier protein ThiS [Pirellulales bacterium]|nr:sulfur carrier protein ThiS [Pirellulales bacterium]